MTMRRNQPINTWESGDMVQGFALVTRKEARQDRNNRTYLDMELSDATGSIDAKVWSDSPALKADFNAHDFIAFKGAVKTYKDQLQISVDEARVAGDADRRYGFDESKLVPSSREDADDLQARLAQVLEQVERPVLRRVVEHAVETWGEALREHPAAKTMHHAYRSGLLEHVVSMAELALRVCGHYPQIDRDLVLVGVLFHDLGKIRELGAMPANDYTLEGRLVGHVVIGRDLLLESCRAVGEVPEELRLHLEHLVLSHQGRLEYASPVEPMTPEALVLHFIDDLDSKLNQLEANRRDGAGLHWQRGLNRYVWLARGEEVWEGAEPASLDVYVDKGGVIEGEREPVDLPTDAPVTPARHPETVEGAERDEAAEPEHEPEGVEDTSGGRSLFD